jgi:hypothetical protein
MAESSESQEVREFMAAFGKLRTMIDDSPELLESESSDVESLRRLCVLVSRSAIRLSDAERSQPELFSARTNPDFIRSWRDYEARYKLPLDRVFFEQVFGSDSDPGVEVLRGDLETIQRAVDRGEPAVIAHWEIAARNATFDNDAARVAIEYARLNAAALPDSTVDDERYKIDVAAGAEALRRLLDDAGFDLEGALRRRALTPFILIPRHVSDRHGNDERLSLFTILQQANDAFVYGAPLAALALMRTILEIVLKNNYEAPGETLEEMIRNVRGLPSDIPSSRLDRVRRLANAILHFNKKDEQRLSQTEKEIVLLQLNLRDLIEAAPRLPAKP